MLLIKVKERGATPRSMRKHITPIHRAGMEHIGHYWHRFYRPEHFKTTAYNRYGIQARTPGDVRRKMKVKHHNRPLVFTGETEALSRIRDIRATRDRVRVVMHTRALNYRRLRGELSVINAAEAQTLTNQYDRVVTRRYNTIQDTVTRTVT